MSNIYLFEENYSEALPTPSLLTRTILITAVLYSAPSRKSTQREKEPSGLLASDTAKPVDHSKPSDQPRRCRITVRVRGTSNSAWAEEHNEIRGEIVKVEQQSSRRKDGPSPSMQRRTNAEMR